MEKYMWPYLHLEHMSRDEKDTNEAEYLQTFGILINAELCKVRNYAA